MSLVNNNQVEICYGWHCLPFVIKDTFYHTLNSSNLNTSFFIYGFLIQSLNIIDFIKSHQFFEFYFLKNIGSLISQRGSINKEQDTFETIRL